MTLPDSSSSSSSSSSSPSPKRRKIHLPLPADSPPPIWRSHLQHHLYTSKLAQTLRRLRRPDSTARAVRAAADRVLAVSARGKTRWSRSILTARLNKTKHKTAKPAVAAAPGIRKPLVHKKPPLPPILRKLKALSRLVPGCRKLSLPYLLEETTDYVAALEMQVKAMAFLAGLLNSGTGNPSPAANQYQHFTPSS